MKVVSGDHAMSKLQLQPDMTAMKVRKAYTEPTVNARR